MDARKVNRKITTYVLSVLQSYPLSQSISNYLSLSNKDLSTSNGRRSYILIPMSIATILSTWEGEIGHRRSSDLAEVQHIAIYFLFTDCIQRY